MRFLITAGPTREPIDPVRFISNRSSGKMGYAIAAAAVTAGHDVLLISGPVCLKPPSGVRFVSVTSSDEMFEAVHKHAGTVDIVVMSAAVSDFKAAKYAPEKIKKHSGFNQISLAPTRDILSSLTRIEKKILIIGFAAETNSLRRNAENKLHKKHCDLIIANDVSRMNTGLESDYNEITLFYKCGDVRSMPRSKKTILARKLVKIFEKMQETS